MKKPLWLRAYGRYKNINHYLSANLSIIQNQYPGRKIFAIGVTGTDGKTTTSALIYHILKTANKKVALINTLGAYVDDKKMDTGLHVTSPGPWFIQNFLRELVKKNYEYVVLESTSHGLDQHRLLGINFRIGVLTNLTHEHLDYHETMEKYAQAKAKLFRTVNTAIINTSAIEKVNFLGLIKKEGIKIIDYDISFLKKYKLLSSHIVKRFPQKYNQLNAIAAVEVAYKLGIADSVIQKAIKSFPQIEGRLEKINNFLGVNAYVDFAHTPNALRELLGFLSKSKLKSKKLIVLFGCAGERDHEKRPIMGKIASDFADTVVLTSEDPRHENTLDIINSVKIGMNKKFKGKLIIEPDRRKAISLAVNELKRGDTIVLCGKGHELSMNISGTEHPWSDKKELLKAFRHKN